MKARKMISFILSVISCMFFAMPFGTAEADPEQDAAEAVLSRFMELTKIPRASRHEERISAYLKNWAESMGFETVQDEMNNIIVEVPATAGLEALPKVGLQGHMDMVFAQQDGLDLDPLTTTIQVVREDPWLRSDGRTSLGADDGIGVSMITRVAEGLMDHGPLRLFFTTNEEENMSGASFLDPKYFSDLPYLINLDHEVEREICVSSAACVTAKVTGTYEPALRSKERGVLIELTGLTGGHSGMDIHKNRLNAGIEMGLILQAILDEGIDFELQTLKGGKADNVIMSSASAAIFVNTEDMVRLTVVLKSLENALKEKGADTDPELALRLTDIEPEDASVLPAWVREALLSLLTNLKNGVRTMSADMEGLVESSSNLGVLDVTPSRIYAEILSRSSKEVVEQEIVNEQRELASVRGFEINFYSTGEIWEYDPDNNLVALFSDSYRRLFGTELQVIAVHAGLECGTFVPHNREMKICSIGPTILNAHSVHETLDISTVEKVWRLLEDVLARIE